LKHVLLRAQATPSILSSTSADGERAPLLIHAPASMYLPYRSRPPWSSLLFLVGHTSQASRTGVVVPVHVNAVNPEPANLARNVGIELDGGQLVEEVVEVDLGELTFHKVRAGRNVKMLRGNNIFHLGVVVPLVSGGNKITDHARIFVVAPNVGGIGGKPVVIAVAIPRCNRTGRDASGIRRAYISIIVQ
jgi:hypothetical protein